MNHLGHTLSECWTVNASIITPIVRTDSTHFTDTPLSINPFTFVSSCLEDYKARHVIKASEPHDTQNRPVFAIPALPPHLTASKASSEPFDVSTNKLNTPKKAPATSKAAFPVIYMDLLLAKIAQLQASSITSLVESIYLDLREFKVKKVAIEAKVREVGEKCKDRKVWVVKPNFQLLVSLLNGVYYVGLPLIFLGSRIILQFPKSNKYVYLSLVHRSFTCIISSSYPFSLAETSSNRQYLSFRTHSE